MPHYLDTYNLTPSTWAAALAEFASNPVGDAPFPLEITGALCVNAVDRAEPRVAASLFKSVRKLESSVEPAFSSIERERASNQEKCDRICERVRLQTGLLMPLLHTKVFKSSTYDRTVAVKAQSEGLLLDIQQNRICIRESYSWQWHQWVVQHPVSGWLINGAPAVLKNAPAASWSRVALLACSLIPIGTWAFGYLLNSRVEIDRQGEINIRRHLPEIDQQLSNLTNDLAVLEQQIAESQARVRADVELGRQATVERDNILARREPLAKIQAIYKRTQEQMNLVRSLRSAPLPKTIRISPKGEVHPQKPPYAPKALTSLKGAIKTALGEHLVPTGIGSWFIKPWRVRSGSFLDQAVHELLANGLSLAVQGDINRLKDVPESDPRHLVRMVWNQCMDILTRHLPVWERASGV